MGGLGKLNKFLSERTYVTGYQVSGDDFALFDKFDKAPEGKMVHVLRWYNHITSYLSERAQYASGSSAAPAAAAAEDETRRREEEIERRAQEQLAKKAASGKQVVAKSAVVFDCKPWDLDTDMVEMERLVREITMEGLTWTASELKEVAFGIKKLSIMCTIIDDLVSTDDIQEQICGFEYLVQSCDIASFSKL